MQLIAAMQEVFRQPPIPYEPQKHSLKAWAKYCLQDRGYKVLYADRADFAIESRTDGKVFFRVTENPADVTPDLGWIVCDRTSQVTTVIPPTLPNKDTD
jgi:hypothetical protein